MLKLFHLKNSNDKIILKNSAIAFLMKGGGLAVSFLSAPAFISYFGGDKSVLGVWFTMLSVLIWFLNFDLGIGNGIRNSLVKAFAANDRKEVKKIISSGFISICSVTLLLTLVGCTILSCSNLNWLFNIETSLISEASLKFSTYIVFIAVMSSFLLTMVNSIFYAQQRSGVNSILSLVFSTLLLLYVLIFKFDDKNTALSAVSVAYLVITVAPRLIAAIYVFSKELQDCLPSLSSIDKCVVKQVVTIGGVFFACQIAYMIICNTNEFFIARYYGPQYATEYGFYYRLTSLVSMMVSLMVTPIWSMVTKAQAEKDYEWLEKLYKRMNRGSLIVVILQFVLVPFEQTLFNLWLGDGFISVNYFTAISFACFGSAFVYSSIMSTIVCGMARMKLQLYTYSIGVILKVVLIDILAVKYFNWTMVIWSNVFILGVYALLEHINLNHYFKTVRFNR